MRSLLYIVILLLAGCASLRSASEACESFVSQEVADVFRRYDKYSMEGFQVGLVYRSRLALERARRSLQGDELIAVGPVCPRSRQRSTTWKELSRDFESAATMVRELEEARGVRFVEFRGDQPIWLDATTGKEVPSDLASSI